MYTKGVMKLALLVLFSLTLYGASKDLDIPDFSQGLSGATLEKHEVSGNQAVFHFRTGLSSNKFSAILKKELGSAWRTQKLMQEDMVLAARRGRTTGSTVNLTVYRHVTSKGVCIRVIHLKPKNRTNCSVEVAVLQGSGHPKDKARK